MTQAAAASEITTAGAHARPALQAVPDSPPRAGAPAPRLEIPPYDLATALALEHELAISHPLAQFLVRRGFGEPAAAREFLHPADSHEPGQFSGIDRSVELIERHIRAGTRIMVHGDYDVDGVCATAIMVRALRMLGANAGWFLPARLDDGYGLSTETVERLASRGTSLLITVDCAITGVAEVASAKQAGLDVVVSDHHAPRADGALPDCPIVHPGVCGYPFRDLCGTAVAHKLARALGASTTEEDLDLVALATVADLVPLRGENRQLVRSGLRVLANTAKPGLRALMAVSSVDPSGLDAHAVGFRLAPRINAAGRMRRADAGLELLLTDDPDRAAEIAHELDLVNGERRTVELRTVWEAQEQIAQLGSRSAFVLAAEGWHPGVIGIVASRIVESHHRPAILVALDGELGTGSGRSIPGFDLLGALHAAAPHLDRYGGHSAAAGLTVRRERVNDLRRAVEQHADAVLTAELLEPVERIDAIVSGADLGLPLAEELTMIEPCGIGNPRARLLVPGARFDDVRAMGEGRHARFSVSSGGTRARGVAFGCDGALGAPPGEPVNATFTLERNIWNGAVEPRLVLRSARPCARSPIEILGERQDFMPAVLDELDAPLEEAIKPGTAAVARTLLDRRHESPLAVLGDALSTRADVLAVCADVPRRLPGLAALTGGFALIAYHALARDPAIADRFSHVVALDPPASADAERLLGHGHGYTYRAWGQAELRFAQQMHEREYGLRASLVALYRALRARFRVTGEELERLLRGDGEHGRPARLAGRLIRVLAELELVSLDRDLPALGIAGTAPTALERSAAYRAYTDRLEDGRRYLSSTNPPRSG
jgi:single-stranded-DNA-specific exonuclease